MESSDQSNNLIQNENWTLVEEVPDENSNRNFEIVQSEESQDQNLNIESKLKKSSSIHSTQFLKYLGKISFITGRNKKSSTNSSSVDQPEYEMITHLIFFWFILVNLVITSIFSHLIRQDLKIKTYLNISKEDVKMAHFEPDTYEPIVDNSNTNVNGVAMNQIIPRLLTKFLDMDRERFNYEYEKETIFGLLKEQVQEMKELKASVHELKLYLDQIQYDIVKKINDFKNDIVTNDNSLRQHSNAWADFVNMVNVMMTEMKTRKLYSNFMDPKDQKNI